LRYEKFLLAQQQCCLVELNNKTIIAVGESNSADGDVLENKGFSDGLIIKIK
jgi:hypothetical protein